MHAQTAGEFTVILFAQNTSPITYGVVIQDIDGAQLMETAEVHDAQNAVDIYVGAITQLGGETVEFES